MTPVPSGGASPVSRERRGTVLLLGLDRAAKRNAFDRAQLHDLAAALGEADADPEVRCTVLFGHGDHFTAGLDLADVGPAVAAGAPLFPPDGPDPLDLGEPRRRKPLVVAVQGWCLTIGVELLLAADMGVAASDARFAQMEVKRGIMPFGGATLRFPARAGWGRAMRWMLTGDTFGADEALAMGLVQEVTPPGGQLDRALALAEAIARQAPLAVQAVLRHARLARDAGAEAALAALPSDARALFATEDAREGLLSFLERREGRFQGR